MPDVHTFLVVGDPEDINSSIGFLRHLVSIMRMKKGGLFSAGVVCGSWTLINRAWVSIPEKVQRHGRDYFWGNWQWFIAYSPYNFGSYRYEKILHNFWFGNVLQLMEGNFWGQSTARHTACLM